MGYSGFIYEWTNKLNGMKYLGSHKGTETDGYIGSGKRFINAVRKYGIENFERTIVEYVPKKEDIFLREQFYLDLFECAESAKYYNISYTACGGNTGAGTKISEIKKKQFASGELIQHNKGKAMADHQKAKHCDEWEVITPDNEVLFIKNMLDFCRQRNLNASAMSAVARGNRSNYKGYKCKKLTNNRDVQYTHKMYVYMTKEDRSNQLKNLARRGADHPSAIKIDYNGVVFGSFAEAQEATGLSYYLLNKNGKRI